MIAFEEKVASFQKESKEFQQKIARGSDEHLDMLLELRNIMLRVNSKTEAFLADIIPSSGKLTDEEAEKAMPGLLDLYSQMIQLKATLKRSAAGKDVGTVATDYYVHVENFRELIYDLETFRNDVAIDELLKDINKI